MINSVQNNVHFEVQRNLKKMFEIKKEKPILAALHITGLFLLNIISIVVLTIIFIIHCKISAAEKVINNEYYNQVKSISDILNAKNTGLFDENQVVKIPTKRTKSGNFAVECNQIKLGDQFLIKGSEKYFFIVASGFGYVYDSNKQISSIFWCSEELIEGKLETVFESTSVENLYSLLGS